MKPTTRIDLPTKVRTKSCQILNQRLADSLDLKLQAKQAHWNVKGIAFIAWHELFDKVAEAADEFSDDLAERIAALGGVAEGTLAAIVPKTKLAPYSLTLSKGTDHLAAVAGALAQFGKLVRADIQTTADEPDLGTSDLLTGMSREVDKLLWFVESHLQGDA